MGRRKKPEPTIGASGDDGLVIELPAIPCFPYQSADVPPPVGVLLLLDVGGGYVLGEWNGRDYIDATYTLVNPTYGEVERWCIILDYNGDIVFADNTE